ncbi:MAG TPA: Ig-like domain-containing protein, partial [Thermomicrobiales bacterium]|nr:Ig-like domain-containing protein [Thermomicrobiales bacterium]
PDLVQVTAGSRTAIDVLSNDTDPESGTLHVIKAGKATAGRVSLAEDSGTVSYRPATGQTGEATFSYTIADDAGNTSDGVVTVTIVAAGNGAPLATNDEFLVGINSPGSVLDVLSNDTDPEGDTLQVQIEQTPEHGEVAVDALQSITYTPDADFHGRDTFTYTIVDGGGLASSATVVIEVQAANQAPIAVADATTIDEDTSSTLPLMANDTDPDGDALAITSISGAMFGTATLQTNGTLIYQPIPDAFGIEYLTYIVSDGLGGTAQGTVQITVNSINDAPVAADDTAVTGTDVGVLIPVQANDRDADGDYLSPAIVQPAPFGLASVTLAGAIWYQPAAGFHGEVSFRYSITDWAGAAAETQVTIVIGEPNTPPIAKNDRVNVVPNIGSIVDPLKNDHDDDGDTLVVVSVSESKHGSAQVINGQIVYTPKTGYLGSDSFTYSIIDQGGVTATATIRLTVTVEPTATP